MPVTRTITRAAIALFLTGCALGAPVDRLARPPCNSDAECGAGMLCYAEGCGDPGSGIVAEVAGDPLAGQYTRDFAIDDGTLGPARDFDLATPLMVRGEFQRERTGNPDPTNRTFYTESVLLRAIGESELIPGITRTYQQKFDKPERGYFQMNLGAGAFTVTALPVDPSVPPIALPDVRVRPGFDTPYLNFAFPAVEGAITVSGRLVKRVDTTKLPAVEIALTDSTSAMDLQAFDPETRAPLSQRFPVSSGTAGAKGDFTMTLNPAANQLRTVLFVATPRVAGSTVPTKTFAAATPLPNNLFFELGDFGEAFKVTGLVKGPDGLPVSGAQVMLEGTVNGDGTFRSRIVLTDVAGQFTVDTLASRRDQTFLATVVPPPTGAAAVTQVPVRVEAGVGGIGTLSTPTLKCNSRLTVTGTVLRPSGTPAQLVTVRAIEQVASVEPGTERPFPLDNVEVTTDAEGHFTMQLDPATWRFEFVAPDLPLASRLVTVRSRVDSTGAPITSVEVLPVQLPEGRKVSGTVRAVVGQRPDAPVANATLRFFRVTSVEGRKSAILLGTALTKESGEYSVFLPTKMSVK